MKTWEYERNYQLENDYWWFRGVRAMVARLLDLAIGEARIGRCLDVGCGTGSLLDMLAPRCGTIVGVDFAAEALAYCRERGHSRLAQADGCCLPFPDASFDCALAIGIIEHIEDDERFLAELARVLRPGGSLVLLTSSFPGLWSEHDVANEHKRRYRRGELASKAGRAGFRRLRLSHLNFFLFPVLAPVLVARRWIFGLGAEAPQRYLPVPPMPINAMLAGILRLEAALMGFVALPWGVSMIGVFRKEAAGV